MFRSSQKIEHLQYQMGVAVTEGSKAISQLSYSTKNAVVHTLNSPTSIHIQEALRNFCSYCCTILDELRCSILYHCNPRMIIHSLTRVFGTEWSRRDVFFGCAGILVGSLFGIGIGIAFHKKGVVFKHMLAVQCTSYVGIEGASATDEGIATTHIKDDEVLINVKAASVQVIDADICSGYGRTLRRLLSTYQYSKHDLPVTLGRDCTGLVVDIGKNVTRFDIGDEVWTTSPYWAQGTMCQYFVANEVDVCLKPSAIGFEGACSIPYAGGVALNVLAELNTSPEAMRGRRIFVQGCCTPVGCILVQLFKVWEAHVTTTCYRRAVPVAEALKVDDVIMLGYNSEIRVKNGQNLQLPELDANVLLKALAARDPFDVIINTRKCGVDDAQFREFCPNGVYFSTAQSTLSEDSYQFPTSFLFNSYVRLKSYYQILFGKQVRNFGEVHICHKTLDELKTLVDTGKLKTLVDRVYHPAEIENALYHIQSTESIGSTVITFR